VYGILKQSSGYIWVDSALERGTSFRIYLPRTEGQPDTAAAAPRREDRATGNETILMVEDDEAVRRLAVKVLRNIGYRVLEAHDGADAESVSAAHAGEIHLLLTDMVMPGVGGREVARRIRQRRPAIKVLFMSGYSAEVQTWPQSAVDAGEVLLQKPFTGSLLVSTVRRVLDASAVPAR
jgi:two-component system, cell cycle sensor histidine kinase and response regulator CckA